MSLVVLPQDALMPWVSVGHRCVTAAMAEAPRPNTCPKCQTEVVGGWDFAGIFCMFFFFCGVLTYPPVIKHGLLENPPFIHDFFQVDLASSPMW